MMARLTYGDELETSGCDWCGRGTSDPIEMPGAEICDTCVQHYDSETDTVS